MPGQARTGQRSPGHTGSHNILRQYYFGQQQCEAICEGAERRLRRISRDACRRSRGVWRRDLKRARWTSVTASATDNRDTKGTSAGMCTMVARGTQASTKVTGIEGEADKPRRSIGWLRTKAATCTIPGCYLYVGLGMKGANLSILQSVGALTDAGRRCLIAPGDWNCTPDQMRASGVLGQI